MQNLSTIPPKGTRDWESTEFSIRKHIFDVWREVCTQFGYQEYLTPLVEYADIYRAKSGEDVGGTELTVFKDRGNRELAIRPEMTPSVTRMVSKSYNSVPKPIRLFSIANFFRNENPQRGRNREFWQLNYDLFGSEAIAADLEIIQIGIEIMLGLGANDKQFVVYLNHRRLIEDFVNKYLKVPEANLTNAIRLIDKFAKMPPSDFISSLETLGATIPDTQLLLDYFQREDSAMQKMLEEHLKNLASLQQLMQVFKKLELQGYGNYVRYHPSMVRGFDYYDGVVFEVFDMHPDNNRAMFGGGRYNGLASIFGGESFPAVGCAPGDETTRLFLEAHNLVPDYIDKRRGYYLPILIEGEKAEAARIKITKQMRAAHHSVTQGLELEKFSKALSSADKHNARYAIILGEEEIVQGKYLIKDLKTGEQQEVSTKNI